MRILKPKSLSAARLAQAFVAPAWSFLKRESKYVEQFKTIGRRHSSGSWTAGMQGQAEFRRNA